jgi:hypothetical protein
MPASRHNHDGLFHLMVDLPAAHKTGHNLFGHAGSGLID